mmetsp:Transcript_100844/g.284460  ORF Transcript_100844/g.284460 Transcript_100844/m.284460 type:complete len:211 (+) Transcript_100844:1289-1921(+)
MFALVSALRRKVGHLGTQIAGDQSCHCHTDLQVDLRPSVHRARLERVWLLQVFHRPPEVFRVQRREMRAPDTGVFGKVTTLERCTMRQTHRCRYMLVHREVRQHALQNLVTDGLAFPVTIEAKHDDVTARSLVGKVLGHSHVRVRVDEHWHRIEEAFGVDAHPAPVRQGEVQTIDVPHGRCDAVLALHTRATPQRAGATGASPRTGERTS